MREDTVVSLVVERNILSEEGPANRIPPCFYTVFAMYTPSTQIPKVGLYATYGRRLLSS